MLSTFSWDDHQINNLHVQFSSELAFAVSHWACNKNSCFLAK